MLEWYRKKIRQLTLYHIYYRRSGLYKFIFKNAIKILSIIIAVLIVFFLIERYIIDFDIVFTKFAEKHKWYNVLIVFFISETFLGLIPPDLFIIWSDQFPNHYLVLTILAFLSYFGGILSFKIGQLLKLIPRVNIYLNNRFKNSYAVVKKWGGIGIVVAALFPLPFSSVSMIAGMMHFPMKYFVIFGLSRIPRFYLYALFFFKII